MGCASWPKGRCLEFTFLFQMQSKRNVTYKVKLVKILEREASCLTLPTILDFFFFFFFEWDYYSKIHPAFYWDIMSHVVAS